MLKYFSRYIIQSNLHVRPPLVSDCFSETPIFFGQIVVVETYRERPRFNAGDLKFSIGSNLW